MNTTALRTIAVLAAFTSLVACSDSNPVGVTDPTSASLAKGSGSGTTSATTVIIALTAPANAAFRGADGKAKFAAKPGERELQIEVEDVPAGTALVISLGGAQIGTATANSFGNARLNLNSKRGDTVPMSVTGMSVVVTTAAGAAVVSGSF